MNVRDPAGAHRLDINQKRECRGTIKAGSELFLNRRSVLSPGRVLLLQATREAHDGPLYANSSRSGRDMVNDHARCARPVGIRRLGLEWMECPANQRPSRGSRRLRDGAGIHKYDPHLSAFSRITSNCCDRLICNQEVEGLIPFVSISLPPSMPVSV
jgi:hypothetical protein